MSERLSYSRLETFKQCPYKYKLIYLDKHHIKSDTIATDFGSLIHRVEEIIGNCLKEGKGINYDELISFFDNEVMKIKETYPDDFPMLDKSGRTYEQKADLYRSKSIYDLEKRVRNEDLDIVCCEKEFILNYNDILFHGFIDRIFRKGNHYIIEDIKTYNRELPKSMLYNPLQFVIYSLAFSSISKDIECSYYLPLCECKQTCIMDMKDIHVMDLLKEIDSSDFHPCPSPLCHWCVFSGTYPNQPSEAKGLCPYYSLWTRENRTKSVNMKWQGAYRDREIKEALSKHLI